MERKAQTHINTRRATPQMFLQPTSLCLNMYHIISLSVGVDDRFSLNACVEFHERVSICTLSLVFAFMSKIFSIYTLVLSPSNFYSSESYHLSPRWC